jgi:hypothetical protein
MNASTVLFYEKKYVKKNTKEKKKKFLVKYKHGTSKIQKFEDFIYDRIKSIDFGSEYKTFDELRDITLFKNYGNHEGLDVKIGDLLEYGRFVTLENALLGLWLTINLSNNELDKMGNTFESNIISNKTRQIFPNRYAIYMEDKSNKNTGDKSNKNTGDKSNEHAGDMLDLYSINSKSGSIKKIENLNRHLFITADIADFTTNG